MTGDLVTAGPDHASDGTAAVSGSIHGRDGWPLESATVTLVDRAGAQIGRATVDAEGHFAVSVTLTRPGDAAVPRPGRWTIDPAHSTIAVTGQHLGLSRIHGRFARFSGELVITDPLERSGCEATIEAASIDTGNEQRDAHLRSVDFMDVDRYPTI